jgi:hypothetical protein
MATKKRNTAQPRARVGKHEWVTARKMTEPHIVMRIDDYALASSTRGQFYPQVDRVDDATKAIWPNAELAHNAAKWAAKTFGRTYGVFKMTAIVEPAVAPIKTTKL